MNAVVMEHPAPDVPSPASSTPAHMLAVALQQNLDIDRMSKVMDLYERWQAFEAKKAYLSAMAKFKANPPKIIKDKRVEFEKKNGGVMSYDHTTLGHLCDQIVDGLAAVGITHSWDTEQKDGLVRVTCILSHELGHSERRSLFAEPDATGNKNSIQMVASTITFLERYTLFAAVGLAPVDDDDGRAAGKAKGSAESPPVSLPEGYESWKADMTAKADEGLPALDDAWQQSSVNFRKHAGSKDATWWRSMRTKAGGVK